MKPEDFGYVVKNNVCLFVKGPLSQWWGGYKGQNGGFKEDNGRGRINEFNCCEQYMMAAKADFMGDDNNFVNIMSTKDPKEQKAFGRLVQRFDPILWDKVKYSIVFQANKQKFEQNKDCRDFLLSFNRHTIFAEAAPWDTVWGIGMDATNPDSLDIYKWQGQNLLGMAISEVRKQYD